MRKFKSVLVFLALTLVSTNSFGYSSDPERFITELVNDAIETLSDKNISKADKAKKVETIALEHVDIKGIGMYTLGSFRKTLDQENLKKYQKLFKKYFLKSLTSRLTDYSENEFEVIGADQKSETTTIVISRIKERLVLPSFESEQRKEIEIY